MADDKTFGSKNLQARDSWQEFGQRMGWRLFGWTFEHSASFIVSPHETITITKTVRRDIERALNMAGG